MEGELYSRILGESWHKLAEPVRRVHAPSSEKHGCFRVTHGTGWLARWLIRWSRLPRAASSARTRLRIVADGATESWERQFDTDQFITRQWAEDDGRLIERFGTLEFCFELRVEGEALHYLQRGARLWLGAFRVRLPLAWAPVVSAKETAAGPERVHVTVSVTVPLAGSLIAYDGHLDLGGTG